MREAFYTVFGIFGLLGGWFVATSLLGHFRIDPLPVSISKVALVLATALGAALLHRAYAVGELAARPGAGLLWVLAAIGAFEGVLVAAKLLAISLNRD